MNALTRTWMLACTALVAVALLAMPAVAQEDTMDDEVVEELEEVEQLEETGDEEESGRRALADNPRDRVGLLLLTAMFVAGGIAVVNGRKQMKGSNPQASGEFRWR